MWRTEQLVEAIAAGLAAHSAQLRATESLRGIDGLAEVELHAPIAAGLVAEGFGVMPEHPYPGEFHRRPVRAERERCDLVITPAPSARVLDPVAALKSADEAALTLFADVPAPPPDGIPPDEAFWLEIKAIGQFTFNAGLAGPNTTYASELIRSGADLRKLAHEPMVRHGALLVVLFTADQRTAEHDLNEFIHRCLDRNLPLSSPSRAAFEIPDLIGNRLCTALLVPVSPGPRD